MTTSIYKNNSFELTSDAFTEGAKKASVTDGILTAADGTTINTKTSEAVPKLSSECPMLDAMYGVSILDHEKVTIDEKTYFYMLCNRFTRDFKIPEGMIPDGPVFWAGYGFNTYLYTRDTAYSSWLGTAYILPEVVESHLKYLRGLRREVGLKVAKLHEIPIPGIPTIETGMTGQEMVQKYNTNCYTRRTDDIIWVLGLWEVYKSTRDEVLLSYILKEFKYFDDNFYNYFFDEPTGLYRGQSSFIDIGGAPYGGRNASNTVTLKTLSTNCLYAGCFSILAKIAKILGEAESAAKLADRREKLAKSIRKNFAPVNYEHYLDDEGGSSGRQEVLGLAFLTLFDIISSAEGAKLLTDFHDGDYGRPLMWPFCGSERIYHDNSTWPFADTIYALAEYKVSDKQDAIRKTMGKLCRHSLHGNFNEVLEWKTGNFVGCPSYIWSAASYLTLVYRMIAGMEVSEEGIVSFAPVLPPELGGKVDLTNLKIAGTNINLKIRGNGQSSEKTVIPLDGKSHEVAIKLN